MQANGPEPVGCPMRFDSGPHMARHRAATIGDTASRGGSSLECAYCPCEVPIQPSPSKPEQEH